MPERQFDLKIRVKASDEASGVLGMVGNNLQKLGTMAVAGFGVVAVGLGAATAGFGAFANEAIRSNAAFEQYETQFATLLKSTEAAQQRMKELARFGATTPFDLPEVVEADRILQGFGLHSEESAAKFGFSGEEIRRIAGDVASGTGASFQEMALLIGRFSSGATGEALMRMAELGIGTREQLTAMGVEFSKSGQLMSPLPQAMNAILTLMKEKYGGLMQTQSQTFEGMMSNLRDWVGNAIRTAGRPIFDKAKEQLGKLLETLNTPQMQQSLETLSQKLGFVAENALKFFEPLLANAPQAIDFLVKAGGAIADFASGILATINGGDAFNDFFANVWQAFPQAEGPLRSFMGALQWLIDFLPAARAQIQTFLEPMIEWVAQNVSLNDVLVGLGVAIGAVVVPAIVSIVSAIAPVLAVFAAVVLAVALLRQAWETDFLGIRTTLTRVWDEGVRPAFETMRDQLFPRVAEIVAYLGRVWEERLLPALQRLGLFVETDTVPQIGDFLVAAIEFAVVALEKLIGVVEWLLPYITQAADNISFLIDRFLTWKEGVEAVGRQLSNLHLPDWLTPGSPTPLELGVWGINDAMDELARKQLPQLSRGLGIASSLQPALAGAGAAPDGSGERVKVIVPVTLDGREVGYGSVEGTLEALRQRGLAVGGSTHR